MLPPLFKEYAKLLDCYGSVKNSSRRFLRLYPMGCALYAVAGRQSHRHIAKAECI
jgi:hypothetical protein